MSVPFIALDLPRFREALKIRERQGQRELWDPVRRRYVAYTPEELVRQLLLRFLISEGHVGRNRISVEKQIRVHGRKRRYDLVIHDSAGDPFVVIECKRPDIPLDQAWFDQIGRYNQVLGAPWMIVTNGPQTVCLSLDQAKGLIQAVGHLPDFRHE